MAQQLAPIRAVQADEAGTDFVDFLYERALEMTETQTLAKSLARRAWVFVQQFDHLLDELREQGESDEVSVERYAERWNEPRRTSFRAFSEFAALFPGDRAPYLVVAELWDGTGRQARNGRMMPFGRVKVVAR